MTTKEEVVQHAASGPWRALMRLAEQLVSDAETASGSKMQPLFGGGTRLMLALNHRISDDIDLFIRDPQWIGYLSPRLNDRAAARVDGYEENAVSLKLRVGGGEIDFIVAMSLLNQPAEASSDLQFEMESVGEVLAKKLFYRGSLLTPRDLFDWWAIATLAPQAIPQGQLASLLKDRWDGVEQALVAMRQSGAAREIWKSLRAPEVPPLDEAIDFGLGCLREYRPIG